jgi:hypothetical protein
MDQKHIYIYTHTYYIHTAPFKTVIVVRLVPVAGSSARVLPPGGQVLPPTLDDVAVGLGATPNACLGQALPPMSDGTVCTTTCHWSRPAVVMQRLLISPFELKFDRLNTNSTV